MCERCESQWRRDTARSLSIGTLRSLGLIITCGAVIRGSAGQPVTLSLSVCLPPLVTAFIS